MHQIKFKIKLKFIKRDFRHIFAYLLRYRVRPPPLGKIAASASVIAIARKMTIISWAHMSIYSAIHVDSQNTLIFMNSQVANVSFLIMVRDSGDY